MGRSTGKQDKHRKEYLLDHHHTNIDEDTGMPAKKKKQIIKSIQRRLKRNRSFKYISKHAGKGTKGSLKRLHAENEKGEIITTIVNKEDMEDKIKCHNLKYFTKAHNLKVHNDKIYAELINSRVRDGILKGRLSRDKCIMTKCRNFYHS